MHSNMLSFSDPSGSYTQQLNRLILVIPLEVGSTRRKVPLLGPDPVLISANTYEQGVKTMFLDYFLKSAGLEVLTAGHQIVHTTMNPCIQSCLVTCDEEVESPLFGPKVAEGIHLWELTSGINMDDRKGYLTQK